MTFDLDVILAAHGAGDGSAVNDAVHSVAQRLERRMVGARVCAAFPYYFVYPFSKAAN